MLFESKINSLGKSNLAKLRLFEGLPKGSRVYDLRRLKNDKFYTWEKSLENYNKWTTINKRINNEIKNNQFVAAVMGENYISTSFALGQNTFKLKGFGKPANYMVDGLEASQTIYLENKLLKNYKIKPDNIHFSIKEDTYDKLFRRIYNNLMRTSGDFNRIGIERISDGKVVSTKLIDDMTYEKFLEILEKDYIFEDIFDLKFTIQYRNQGFGGSSLDDVPLLLQKRGITIIYNDDNLCGQRCLVFAECKTNDELTDMKKEKSLLRFNNRLANMCKELNLNSIMSFIDFNIYSDLYQKQVVILTALFTEIYTTDTEYCDKIYIYWDSNKRHYHFIHDINAATNDKKRNNKWCAVCNTSIRREQFDSHKCKDCVCSLCKTDFKDIKLKNGHFTDAKKNKSWAKCDICNVYCPDECCLDKHIGFCNGNRIKCDDCKKWIDADRMTTHKCGEIHCKNCDSYHFDKKHRCFVQVLDPKNDYTIVDGKRTPITWNHDIYGYDFESKFGIGNEHIVNLVKVKKLHTGDRYEFKDIESFVKWTLTLTNSTFIAHNGKAYDNWLVHKYIMKHTEKKPNKLILAGQKIMYMKIKSIRWLDSINHISGGLANFPKTFSIKETKKGYFPYLFNTDENKNYIGSIPDKKYFNTNSMSNDSKAPMNIHDFTKWYSNNENIVYDFQKELNAYCESDVDLLVKGLEIYIEDALQTTGIHPLKCPTIASYCMRVFRTNFMEENSIAVLTKEEYDFIKRGFFGGRTEVFQSHKKWTHEEIQNGKFGKYIDIQSLYPSVQYFDELPCGIPKWDIPTNVVDSIEYLQNHFGYIECDVIPPSNIHIPLLPEKSNGKLMFDLIEKTNAVYSSVELIKALEIGYIVNIKKCLYFEKTKSLFKDYVSTFLKIKTENSGYDENETGMSIDKYIEVYYLECGVKLDKENIKINSGKKALAKMCLNSLWGKFGQNDSLPITEYITSKQWFNLLDKHAKGSVQIKNEVLIDESTLYVSYIQKNETHTSLISTNLGLAGFVTAQARLRLFDELYKLDERVIYCDTDSIIYEYDSSKYNTEEGLTLGKWELEKDGHLKEFIGHAPKTYGYKTLNDKCVVKCKGVSLNFGNCKYFNFDSLKNLIHNGKEIITYSDEFVKDNKKGIIYTKDKVEKITNSNTENRKRKFDNNGSSKPFI